MYIFPADISKIASQKRLFLTILAGYFMFPENNVAQNIVLSVRPVAAHNCCNATQEFCNTPFLMQPPLETETVQDVTVVPPLQ